MNKEKMIQCRVDVEDLSRLDYIVDATDRTRSNVLRWLIRKQYREMQRDASKQSAQDSTATE